MPASAVVTSLGPTVTSCPVVGTALAAAAAAAGNHIVVDIHIVAVVVEIHTVAAADIHRVTVVVGTHTFAEAADIRTVVLARSPGDQNSPCLVPKVGGEAHAVGADLGKYDSAPDIQILDWTGNRPRRRDEVPCCDLVHSFVRFVFCLRTGWVCAAPVVTSSQSRIGPVGRPCSQASRIKHNNSFVLKFQPFMKECKILLVWAKIQPI